MTGKERAKFRAEANRLEPIMQIGKGGLTPAVISQIQENLKTKELIKVKVLLETSPETPKELAPKIAESVQAEIIQVIGGCLVFYKYNEEIHEAERKKKAEAKERAKKAAEKKRRAEKFGFALGKERSYPSKRGENRW